jgi:hypothetical protein
MPITALMGFLLFFLLAFGLRSWIHYRRTGATGFVGISGAFGSPEWIGGVGFVVAIAAAFAAPVLQLAGVVHPIASFDRPGAHAAGLVFFAAGLAGTLWAQLTMGESWRIGVDAGARTALVDSGPFRWVRNPIFSAMTLRDGGLGAAHAERRSFVCAGGAGRRSRDSRAARRGAASFGHARRGLPALCRRDRPLRPRNGATQEEPVMERSQEGFVPALGTDRLTPFYDAVAFFTGAQFFKRRLVKAARIEPGQRVLDIGCGTGSLVLMVKRACPEASVVGLDVDEKILTIARRKLATAGADVELRAGSATAPAVRTGIVRPHRNDPRASTT